MLIGLLKLILKRVNDTTFQGHRFSSGWASDQREYFTLILSKPVTDFIIYDGDKKFKAMS